MSYQVIARKWRPQKFDDVVGQQAVTRTLRNALASQRLAQAFVFAGPRGVGKTTTARILARALNCAKGPTPDPCGQCDACVEIAEGRDIDVLEIDAATHTQVDNIRDVIVTGLSITPVRNRYKVFIIDEVHQLSSHAFNALLKSIEEPPPHVVFMMATTELEKIPDTVTSRSQVYEFRTISSKAIAQQLRRIVDAEQIQAGDEALQLIARDAEGSMRDAQSKLDQVIAFTGPTISSEDVAMVLGLVGRDLLLDALQAVADEDAAAAFALAGRAVEMGYDLRAVVRELSRVVRDLLVLSVDPLRISDPEIAGEGERNRLTALVARFSREDLLRAFDLLTRAEADVRSAAQPRYQLEMALLRWIHLRKLVPIEDLIASAMSTGAPKPVGSGLSRTPQPATAKSIQPAAQAASTPSSVGSGFSRTPQPTTAKSIQPATPPPAPSIPSSVASGFSRTSSEPTLKDSLLAEIRKSKTVFYNTVVAQAQKIELAGDRVTFTFSPTQRALRDEFERNRPWLESAAQQIAGRKIAVAAVQADAAPVAPVKNDKDEVNTVPAGAPSDPAASKKSALREKALADAGVQALLEVFPAEIRDVEEM
jgi:DNA polymerase-3 subunit gamma/tau